MFGGLVVLCKVVAILFGGVTVTLGGMVPIFGEYGHYIWGYVGGMLMKDTTQYLYDYAY